MATYKLYKKTGIDGSKEEVVLGGSSSLKFTSVSISANGFVADTTYTAYPFRASVTLAGVTADMLADVVFSVDEATSGKFAPVCETYAGGVYLYSTEANASAITIPMIEVRQ